MNEAKMGVITVNEFEEVVKVFGFDSSVTTAVWNTMEANPDNQDEFETVYHKHMTGKY